MTTPRWAEAIYSSEWSSIFYRIAQDTFGGVTDARSLAEDARQELAVRLARLTPGRGRDLSRAYIYVAFKRALIDAHRSRFGRPMPRKWLRDLGPLGSRLFELYCLMRLSVGEVLAAVRDDPALTATTGQTTLDLLREMERRGECDGRAADHVPLGVSNDSARPVVDPQAEGADPAERAVRDEALALQQALFGEEATDQPVIRQGRLAGASEKHLSLSLSDEERVVLRGFREGLPERRIGELLGGLTVRQVRYRRRAALDKLRQALAAAGLTLDDLLD